MSNDKSGRLNLKYPSIDLTEKLFKSSVWCRGEDLTLLRLFHALSQKCLPVSSTRPRIYYSIIVSEKNFLAICRIK